MTTANPIIYAAVRCDADRPNIWTYSIRFYDGREDTGRLFSATNAAQAAFHLCDVLARYGKEGRVDAAHQPIEFSTQLPAGCVDDKTGWVLRRPGTGLVYWEPPYSVDTAWFISETFQKRHPSGSVVNEHDQVVGCVATLADAVSLLMMPPTST